MHSIVRERCPSTAEVNAALNFIAPTLVELRHRLGTKRARHERLFGPLETIAHRGFDSGRARALHAELGRAVRATNDVDRELGRALRRFRGVDGVAGLGFARFGDYVRERLGQSLRWSQNRLRLDRLLDACPLAAAAHAGGELTTSQALTLAPVLRPEAEAFWLEMARNKTVRELRLAVRKARDGVQHDEGDEPAECVSIPAPAAAADLFDHAIDVVRRVAGSHLPVAACVEHMLAEHQADAGLATEEDVDDDLRSSDRPTSARGAGGDSGLREEQLEIRHDRWHRLQVMAAATNSHVNSDPPHPVPPTPHALDRELRRLIRARRERHDRLARLLVELKLHDGWRVLGFASLAHYAREGLGISPRLVQELERVAARLASLPTLATAHARGELSWSKLRLITSVARCDTEAAWLDRARRCTVRYLEREVHRANRRREIDPEGWARDGSPSPLTFDAPYSERSPLRPGAGLWDAPHMSAPQEPEASTRPSVELPCVIRFWLPETVADDWWRTDRSIGGQLDGPSAPWERLLVLIRHFLDQWDISAYENWSEGARVHRRFGWMCACPGCTARRNLEQHHIVFRSRGGSDEQSNLVTLCATHHRRLLHEESIVSVHGRNDGKLTWSLPAATYRGDVRVPST